MIYLTFGFKNVCNDGLGSCFPELMGGFRVHRCRTPGFICSRFDLLFSRPAFAQSTPGVSVRGGWIVPGQPVRACQDPWHEYRSGLPPRRPSALQCRQLPGYAT